ncbi:TPR repeat-containing protein, partial [Periconia macrospinosa]
ALGNEHPDTLTSIYCLAFLFHQQHRYEAASELYERASSGYQQVLGPEHPTTVACLKQYSSLMQEMMQHN